MLFLKENLGFSVFFFSLFQNSLFWLFRFYNETESFDVLIEPKQTEDPPKQFEIQHIWVFSENLWLFRFVSICYECFGCFDIG